MSANQTELWTTFRNGFEATSRSQRKRFAAKANQTNRVVLTVVYETSACIPSRLPERKRSSSRCNLIDF